MLPAPKRKLPAAESSKSGLAVNRSMAAVPRPKVTAPRVDDDEDPVGTLLPPSVARFQAKVPSDEPIDLFGLSAPLFSHPTQFPS